MNIQQQAQLLLNKLALQNAEKAEQCVTLWDEPTRPKK